MCYKAASRVELHVRLSLLDEAAPLLNPAVSIRMSSINVWSFELSRIYLWHSHVYSSACLETSCTVYFGHPALR